MKVYLKQEKILKRAILETGKNYYEIASDIGYSKQYLSHIFNRKCASGVGAKRLCDYLRVDFDKVFSL